MYICGCVLCRQWKHYYHQRELLADRLVAALNKHIQEDGGVLSSALLPATMPTATLTSSSSSSRSSRLTELLKQGFAYQMEKLHKTGDNVTCSNKCQKCQCGHQVPKEQQQSGQQGHMCAEDKSGQHSISPSRPRSELTGQLEYPCVRRVLEDYCPAQPPTCARAVLTVTRPPLPLPLHTSLSDLVADTDSLGGAKSGNKANLGVDDDNTIASIAFTSPSVDSSTISAVGGGNAGILYGWRFSTAPLRRISKEGEKGVAIDRESINGETPLHRPVWRINLDQVSLRKNSGNDGALSSKSGGNSGSSSGGEHGRNRFSMKIRDICCSAGGLLAASRSDGSVTLLRSSKHESRVLYPQTSTSRCYTCGEW